ncbi:MAG: hypothetical protein V4561_03645 [Bacteroidota bacterium]
MKLKSYSKLWLVCLLITFKSALYGQSKFTDYYVAVNKAELAICDSNFDLANKFYKEAFIVSKGKSFNRDLTNAFLSAMDSKNYTLAEEYFSGMQKKEIDSSGIKKILDNYQGDALDKLKSFINKQSDTKYTLKYPAIKQLKELVNWDQGVRGYYSKLYDGDYMVDSVHRADSIIAQRLMQIFNKNGLPDEKTLNECAVIILHNQGSYSLPNLFDTMLYKAVRNFDVDARKFVYLIEKRQLRHSFKFEDVILNFPLSINGASYYKDEETVYLEYYDDSSEQTIDAERQKIGLEPLADFRKKNDTKNRVEKTQSILAKYTIGAPYMKIGVAENEDKLAEWIAKNGKNAPVKKALSSLALFNDKSDTSNINILRRYIIDQTTFQDKIKWYKTFTVEEYYTEKTPYMNLNDRTKFLNWNYHTELIENPKENLFSDSGRSNSAIFIDGYRIIAESGILDILNFKGIELLFDNEILINFTAHFIPNHYQTFIHHLGQPHSTTIETKKVKSTANDNYFLILKTKKMIWQKDNLKSEVVVYDFIDKSGKKKTDAIYNLTQIEKHNAYLNKVKSKKALLDKMYKKSIQKPSTDK